MICLDNTDTLEAGASVDAVVDYTIHGLVAGVFTQIAAGQLSDTDPTVIYTAAAAASIVSVIFVNTHSAAVTLNLYLDPANGGNPRRMLPKDISLGIGYSLHFDGQRLTIVDASGNVQTMPGLHAARHLAAGADPITTMVTSTNVITDHKLIRGDGGVRGAQEATIIVSDNGEMTNPSQPAFMARPTSPQENIAVSDLVTVLLGTESIDQANNFSSNTFTAPITGNYLLAASVRLASMDIDATNYSLRLITSNETYITYGSAKYSADGVLSLFISLVADMDANDTAYLQIYQNAGAQQTDIATDSVFSGNLIC